MERGRANPPALMSAMQKPVVVKFCGRTEAPGIHGRLGAPGRCGLPTSIWKLDSLVRQHFAQN
ncbi:hypothetical protein KIN20_004726 [Parelaphostrongylus tenuis]|uniref:Uncharacterized protein n=1 Tax=Parelaphostrongylus tenuis TaxID=148309 RepID=A0AAD5MKC9_PARTN|nr:hypothetical protein KIN20_004726 [Parelaphostrongylus tenuis]